MAVVDHAISVLEVASTWKPESTTVLQVAWTTGGGQCLTLGKRVDERRCHAPSAPFMGSAGGFCGQQSLSGAVKHSAHVGGGLKVIVGHVPYCGRFCSVIRADGCGGLLFLAIPCMARRSGAVVQHCPEQKFQLGRILSVLGKECTG